MMSLTDEHPVSGIDGHMFIDTAFLGQEWRLDGIYPASKFYSCSEEAIWDMCPGCVDERGWLEIDNARGHICKWMDQAANYDGTPMVGKWVNDKTGEWFTQCYYRREAWIQEEIDERCKGQEPLF